MTNPARGAFVLAPYDALPPAFSQDDSRHLLLDPLRLAALYYAGQILGWYIISHSRTVAQCFLQP
jgi:hypothetical protein